MDRAVDKLWSLKRAQHHMLHSYIRAKDPLYDLHVLKPEVREVGSQVFGTWVG